MSLATMGEIQMESNPGKIRSGGRKQLLVWWIGSERDPTRCNVAEMDMLKYACAR